MTDKPNSYVLGKGTLHFRHLGYQMDQTTFNKVYAASIAKESIGADIYERFINAVMFDMRVTWIVGYNPQKLLPAPDKRRTMRERLDVWANYGDLEAHGIKPYPYQEAAMKALTSPLYTPEGRPNVERWNEVDATPLEDIRAWIGGFSDHDQKPFVLTQTMYDKIQATLRAAGIETNIQMVTYMHAAFVHESDLGDRTPRGRIEIFDYEDGTVINLEGAGEVPGLIDDDFWLNPRDGRRYSPLRMKPTVEPIRRQPSYLDHDPTKRHKRRKKR